MAHATKAEAEVTVTVPVIRLDLTLEEAATLRQVCQHIGGAGQGRKDMDAINNALVNLGVGVVPLADHDVDPDLGSIYFV
jgi:hypothetical protein